ncbi:monocarboxylate transporter 12-like, partial [Mizuhopecten yessoensis]|uniref:monocarboxylate transporter 12-like n=1 Tax=Mizuhopecten yessoensis TaxID=6573 RepID=UPI000B45B58F
IALGFFHGPSTYVIGQYFEKRRSLANACMAAGGSIGGLVLPSLFQNLLETYGLRGALLLTSAVIFHTSIGAMLMRPPTYYIQPGNQDVHLMKENKEDDGPITNDISQLQASADFSAQETTGDLNGPDRERKSCLSVILNDLSLLRNPVMVLFLFVYCMGSIGSAYGHIYITALARDIGINS